MSNADDEKCNMLISLSPTLRSEYKGWCKGQGISMNSGILAMLETVTSKKKYKLQRRVLELQAK